MLSSRHVVNKANTNLLWDDLLTMYIQESFAEEEFIKQVYNIYEETMHYEQEPEDTIKD